MKMYNLFIIDQERCSLNINQPSDRDIRLEQRHLFLPAGVTASLTYVYTAGWTFQLASFCSIVYAAQKMRWRDRRWPSPPLRVVADRTSRKTENEGDSWKLVPYSRLGRRRRCFERVRTNGLPMFNEGSIDPSSNQHM